MISDRDHGGLRDRDRGGLRGRLESSGDLDGFRDCLEARDLDGLRMGPRDRLEASGDLGGLIYNFCLFVDSHLPASEHVRICHFIESSVLRVAQHGEFTAVLTNNTNPVTQVYT